MIYLDKKPSHANVPFKCAAVLSTKFGKFWTKHALKKMSRILLDFSLNIKSCWTHFSDRKHNIYLLNFLKKTTNLKTFQRSWEVEAQAPGLDSSVHGDHNIGLHPCAPGIPCSKKQKAKDTLILCWKQPMLMGLLPTNIFFTAQKEWPHGK